MLVISSAVDSRCRLISVGVRSGGEREGLDGPEKVIHNVIAEKGDYGSYNNSIEFIYHVIMRGRDTTTSTETNYNLPMLNEEQIYSFSIESRFVSL